MEYIGKIDRGIYQCVTKDMVTEEVIITEEQMAHIMERHPEDYAKCREYFAVALEHLIISLRRIVRIQPLS